ncbi:unnamed protein product [Pleuronectes platessa]|uniref:Uncharacterized protein n=1 Tax=Pleuronectes platessa TaxID=8262 RepID=A0A9N7YX93_PLEPL|nr:unnamed protein product [Pleuronectes platessa]
MGMNWTLNWVVSGLNWFNREEEHKNREVSDSIFTWTSRRKESEQKNIETAVKDHFTVFCCKLSAEPEEIDQTLNI